MSIIVSGEVSLDEVIPIIDRLSGIEKEELRQFLDAQPKINWNEEWEQVMTYFHSIFQKFPDDAVMADFDKVLNEVRSGKTN